MDPVVHFEMPYVSIGLPSNTEGNRVSLLQQLPRPG
jgi:hypothetical protein